MPSVAYLDWSTARATALDEIENAHRAVGGTGPGRRYLTQQINQAYAVLLSSQFQAFCRELHSECVDHLVSGVTPAIFRTTLADEFRLHRRIDRGNPNPGKIGADFNRLGLDFWTEALAADGGNASRRQLLGELNEWRNAIAHHDFTPAMLRAGHAALHLSQVQTWRRACDGLARSFDAVMRRFIANITGTGPW
jgi:hypothetical protein